MERETWVTLGILVGAAAPMVLLARSRWGRQQRARDRAAFVLARRANELARLARARRLTPEERAECAALIRDVAEGTEIDLHARMAMHQVYLLAFAPSAMAGVVDNLAPRLAADGWTTDPWASAALGPAVERDLDRTVARWAAIERQVHEQIWSSERPVTEEVWRGLSLLEDALDDWLSGVEQAAALAARLSRHHPEWDLPSFSDVCREAQERLTERMKKEYALEHADALVALGGRAYGMSDASPAHQERTIAELRQRFAAAAADGVTFGGDWGELSALVGVGPYRDGAGGDGHAAFERLRQIAEAGETPGAVIDFPLRRRRLKDATRAHDAV
jgi:hypothetical protein